MNIGIDKISFFVPKYYLSLETLANARNIDPNKYIKGLMQEKMAIAPFNQDTISMGANAAFQMLKDEDLSQIDLVLFATETGVDHSKAAASNLLSILGLNKSVRFVELKQACYAATIAIQLAKSHVYQNPESKVLVIASDIARYGLNTDGEPTQGAGSVSILISKDPKIAKINNYSGIYSEDIYDFFRPIHMDYALVDGHYSNEMYKKFFHESFSSYLSKSKESLSDFDALTFHIPYAKIGLRSLQLVANEEVNPNLFKNYHNATIYNKQVGNIYTGSLYLSLISLLEQGDLKAGAKIGLYSYGSGAIGEFYSLTTMDNYKQYLLKKEHEMMLENRESLTMSLYETHMSNIYKDDAIFSDEPKEIVTLKEINLNKRIYKKNI